MFVPISDIAWINTTDGPVELVHIDEVEGEQRIIVAFKSGRDYIMQAGMNVVDVLTVLNQDEVLHSENDLCMGSLADAYHWIHPKCRIKVIPHNPHFID